MLGMTGHETAQGAAYVTNVQKEKGRKWTFQSSHLLLERIRGESGRPCPLAH